MSTRRNALDSYARREINARAISDYAPSMKPTTARKARAAAARDATYGGATSGWWNVLIYPVDVYRMADRNRRAIAEAVAEYLAEVGQPEAAKRVGGERDAPTPCDMLAACTLARPFKRWQASATGADDAQDTIDDALAFGLRFAVEWYASAYASELDA